MFDAFFSIETLRDIFIYNPKEPMIFSAPLFWGFFMFVLLVYQGVFQKIFWRNLFLTAVSLFFYYKSGGFYLFLLVFSTITDYYLSIWIFKTRHKGWKLFYLIVSLIANLGLLAFYKYAYLLTDFINYLFHTNFVAIDYLALLGNALGGNFDITKILLPVGISFYVFQTLSYTIDVYRGHIPPTKSIWDFAFFVTFFPQLVAGPIVRASDFIPQIYQKYTLTTEQYNKAIFMILGGLVKKVLISDYISVNYVDRVFANPLAYTGLENLLAVYGYALQIYCDFSGYTDIAIGISMLLGFWLPVNFNSPYKSDSITDFWRRWHISLSSWLRDYLYISLGGNRGGSLFTYLSFPITAFIFLAIDGFRWEYALVMGFIMILWTLWMRTQHRAWAIVALNGIVIFWGVLYLAQYWYLLVMASILFIFWLAVLIRPHTGKSVSTYANLSITMLLGGLWHGAHLKFLLWGALHGFALAAHKFWMEITNTQGARYKGLAKLFMQVLTFHFVCFCWMYFRANDILLENGSKLSALEVVNQMLRQITGPFLPTFSQEAVGKTEFYFQILMPIMQVLEGYITILVLIAIAYAIHWFPSHWKLKIEQIFSNLPDLAKAFIITIVVYTLYQGASAGIQPFIYFQF